MPFNVQITEYEDEYIAYSVDYVITEIEFED